MRVNSYQTWFVRKSMKNLDILEQVFLLAFYIWFFLRLWPSPFSKVTLKLSLFRSFGVVPANRGVKAKGLYAIVRHPMYAGYFYTHIGLLLTAPTLWNFAVYTCCWGLLLSRIFAEERILLRSPDYQDYKERVHYRLIPGVL